MIKNFIKNLGIQEPKEKCEDKNCPFHGTISIHGRFFTGKVTSMKRQKTVKVSWEWKRLVPKYERYERKQSVVHAHVPPCIKLKDNDIVIVGETKPISKTKNFIVLGLQNNTQKVKK